MEQQQPMGIPQMPKEIRDYLDTTYREYFNVRSYRAGAIDLWEKLAPEMEAMRKAMEGIIKWEFATDGRKFDSNQEEVLKTVIAMVKDVLDQYPSPKDKDK